MSTMSGLPKSFKLMQNRLCCLSKMQSRATTSSTSQMLFHNVRSLDTYNRYCVFNRYGCHQLGLRLQFTSAFCKVINRKQATFSFCVSISTSEEVNFHTESHLDLEYFPIPSYGGTSNDCMYWHRNSPILGPIHWTTRYLGPSGHMYKKRSDFSTFDLVLW